VILASSPPQGLSLHNVLSGTVIGLHAEPSLDQVVVQLAVGNLLLLAEVTRDAVERLQIAPGTSLYALIKSVSMRVG
jgi:molybdate transport system ATP-binding protein